MLTQEVGVMKKSKMDAMCAEWLEHLEAADKEQLAAFQEWMAKGADDPARCVTVQEVVAAWQRMIEQKRLH